MINGMQAPIPGQSLTTPPGSFPFERPPEITDLEEAIQMHLTRLNSPEMKKDILDTLELDVSVRQLTEGILRSAVAEGIHSIDVSLSVAPVLHEFIRLTAKDAKIDFDVLLFGFSAGLSFQYLVPSSEYAAIDFTMARGWIGMSVLVW